MNITTLKNTAIAATAALGLLAAAVQSSSAMPIDTSTFTAADDTNAQVQTVGWTTKQKQAAGWGLAAGLLTGVIVSGAVNKKKQNNALKMHIAYCSGKHPTYDASTNMYLSNKGWKYCNSPYL